MAWLRLYGTILLLAGSAAAAETPEQIDVTGTRISGYWYVIGPELIEIKAGLGGVWINYSANTVRRDICLIRHLPDGLAASCASGGGTVADGDIAKGRVRLQWWHGPVNVIFTGQWDHGSLINGAFSGGVIGIRVTGHVPARLEKLAAAPPVAAQPGSAAAIRSVIENLNRHNVTPALYDGEGLKRVTRNSQDWIAPTQYTATYLGQVFSHWRSGQLGMIEDVYEIKSGNGVSLCRINLNARGQVNDFSCSVAVPG